MKVLKFGGTALADAKGIRNVAGIIGKTKDSIVVLAALAGTTDTLLEIAGYLYNRNLEGARDTIGTLEKKYLALAGELYESPEQKAKASDFIKDTFRYIKQFTKELFTETQEKLLLAQGELLSTQLMAFYLGDKTSIIPALSFMRLDANREPDMDVLRGSLELQLDAPGRDRDGIVLTQGYICLNAREEVDNLGRGGSDFTACLIGAALKAEEIQIWTDIDGLHNNDARYVPDTAPVPHLHFEEAAELAYFGARILHPTCILPARYAGIPVRLLNTNEPEAPGTLIDNNPDSGVIKAVAAKDNIVAIKIKSSRMLLAHGFLRKVFEIFESYRTSIDMICTSEVGVSLTIDDTRYLSEIVHDLKQYGTVSVDLDMCIVCVVGDMAWSNRGFESRVLSALKDIPVRMVSYGGSNYNISILVREEDKAATLKSLSAKRFADA